jgi:hypothetical protein
MIFLDATIAAATLANRDAAAVVSANLTASASLTVAIVSFIGTVLTGLFSWRNADKTADAQTKVGQLSAEIAALNSARSVYSTAVTTERSKWINALRENIASLSGNLRTLSYNAATTAPDPEIKKNAVRDVNKLISLIALQLNPFGVIEGNIRALIDKLPSLADRSDTSLLRKYDTLLIEHSRWLLKAEWNKVKAEAAGTDHSAAELQYLDEYKQFCEKQPVP